MLTEEVFRTDSYLKECEATVVSVNDLGGIILDRTNFYPTGGGQLVIRAFFDWKTAAKLQLQRPSKVKATKTLSMYQPKAEAPATGTKVVAVIDWERRYKHMQMHTALHLMCNVVPAGVTGNQIGTEKSRMDFDMGDEKLDKDTISQAVNALIDADHPTRDRLHYRRRTGCSAGKLFRQCPLRLPEALDTSV